jgi:PKD repeat protein
MGAVTFSLPVGEYHFWVDKNGVEFWSGPVGHCLVTGCSLLTMTLSSPSLPPVADFVATPVSGMAPLTVTFVNSSTHAAGYSRNFADTMTTSTTVSPILTHTEVGVYTATLTAIGADGGSTSLTKTNYLTVTSAVVANFPVLPLSSSRSLLVQFLNNSTGADSYLWNFGDGITSTVIHPIHIYPQVIICSLFETGVTLLC